MTKNAQRQSQVVSTFAPGAMIDLPTRSVVIGGLDLWDMKGGAFTTVPEPRMTARLEQLLRAQGRLEAGKSLSIRTPPLSDSRPGGLPNGIITPLFPAWFVCEYVEIGCREAGTPPPAGAMGASRSARRSPQIRVRRWNQVRGDSDPLRLRV